MKQILTLKVPRDEFKKIYKDCYNSYFEADKFKLDRGTVSFEYKMGNKRVRVVASIESEDFKKKWANFADRTIISAFNKTVKYPKLDIETLPQNFDVKQLQWSNKKYDNIPVEYAISYDVNSCFNFVEVNMIPDTDRRYSGKIRPGDFGIVEKMCTLRKELVWSFAGEGTSEYCYPLIKWNAKKFVDKYYKDKLTAKTPEEREKAKAYLTHHIGLLKYHNQVIRSWIIWQSNNYIKKFIDKDTIMCNTDCIISLKDRSDIPVGTRIGEFKVENKGKFAKVNMDYQFYDTNKIVARGIKKNDRKNFDILGSNKIIKNRSAYRFIDGRFVNYEI